MPGNRYTRSKRAPYPGVVWKEHLGKWRVDFYARGEKLYLGLFVELEDAIAKRKAAEDAYRKIDPSYGVKRHSSLEGGGVWYDKRDKNWRVRIKGKSYGSCRTKAEAIRKAEKIRADLTAGLTP